MTVSLYLRIRMSLSGFVRNSCFSASVYGFGSSDMVRRIHIGDRTKVVISRALRCMAGRIWTAEELCGISVLYVRLSTVNGVPAPYQGHLFAVQIHALIPYCAMQHAALEVCYSRHIRPAWIVQVAACIYHNVCGIAKCASITRVCDVDHPLAFRVVPRRAIHSMQCVYVLFEAVSGRERFEVALNLCGASIYGRPVMFRFERICVIVGGDVARTASDVC
jgi:hypothetical protein